MIRCSAHINSFHSSPSAIKRSTLSAALLSSVWARSVCVPAQSHRCRNPSWFSSLSLSCTHTLRQINSWPLWCHPSPGQSERPEGWVQYVSAKQGSTLESQSDGPCGPEREADGKETHTHTHDQLWRSATVGQSVRVGACQHCKSTLFGCT